MAAETEEQVVGRGLKRGRNSDNEGSDSEDFDYGEGGQRKGHGAIFVLENASLEVGKVGKTMQLLNCDDHAGFLRKHRKDPADYRPDICHQVSEREERTRSITTSVVFVRPDDDFYFCFVCVFVCVCVFGRLCWL